MARPDEQRLQDPLLRMLKSLAEDPSVLCLSALLLSAFRTGTESVRFRGFILVGIFRISVPTRFEQVMRTYPLTMACFVAGFRSRKRLYVEGVGFMAPPVLNLQKFSDRGAHLI